MKFQQVGDITVHYRLDGPETAPVLVFANSLGTDLRIWDAVVADLAADWRVLRYDLRGHGLSDVTPGPYSMDRLAEDLEGLLDALGLDRVSLCGLSIGGMIAQQFAGTRPDRVERVVFCDTTMRMPEPGMWDERAGQARRDGLDALAEAAIGRWFTEPVRQTAFAAGIRNMVARTTVEGYAACCEAIRDMDLEPRARAVRAPALVVVGEHDPATPPEAAAALAEALPDSRLEVLEGLAHLGCVEQPGRFVSLLRDFLSPSPWGDTD